MKVKRLYKPIGMVDSYNHEVAEKLDGKLERMSVVYRKRRGKWDGQGTSYTPGKDKMYGLGTVSGAKESMEGQGIAPAGFVR